LYSDKIVAVSQNIFAVIHLKSRTLAKFGRSICAWRLSWRALQTL